ncbi:HlyD family efflux transporter periplasmic adaptor subunit [Aeoliella sp. ICT_H6.2]|uniref:HlyD family efflux transporter periplasmic adaptor subunit n=1 Tax=Aeoliella straminimaris TaxID=2954799 RepID=A0A9X2FCK3_9BACT|nr:HlyD family efflux transporter periplasmic adaptor subunit [Aeoliella straminimaris]MCO6045547.1 HlyD family efflux transporter periplasmic adaptor subunit [Aeoliella straminimaris]
MVIGLLITFGYCFFLWLMFFKLKLLKFSPIWAVVSFWFGLHLLLLFIICPRFFQPASEDMRIIRHNVQLVPRLPEPTLLMDVLVEPDAQVKKGTPLFQFDKRIYEYRVQQAKAQLAAAQQRVLVLQANVDAVSQEVAQAQANKNYAQSQVTRYEAMSRDGAASVQNLQQWQDQLAIAEADIKAALANQQKAKLEYESNIDGVNTSVAEAQAELQQQEYYLEQTTLVAPADGFITNLQAQPGLVVGGLRVGAIASFICEEDPYVLATFFQEHLKYVKEGQPVEIALDTHPGKIFDGTVEAVWKAAGQGQMMPQGSLPTFEQPLPKGRFPVKIRINHPDSELAAGVQGSVAIYTDQGTSFSILRRIEIRSYSYGNYLYPMPF